MFIIFHNAYWFWTRWLCRNPENKDWGLGQVQSIIGNKVTVNFEIWKKSNKYWKCYIRKIENERKWIKKIAEGLIDTFDYAGEESKKLYDDGLKIEIKKDKSPVSNGDLRVNDILSKKISELTPNIRIISEETVDIKVKNKSKIFWLIDPIDGTKEYIAGKDEYTLNAALIINTIPVLGLVGVPKKNRLFYTYAPGESYLLEKTQEEKLIVKNNSLKESSCIIQRD